MVKLGLLEEEQVDHAWGYRFDYETTSKLDEFLEQLDETKPRSERGLEFDHVAAELNERDSTLLELAATAVYLRKQAGLEPDKIGAELRRLKPHLESQVDRALRYVDDLERRGG